MLLELRKELIKKQKRSNITQLCRNLVNIVLLSCNRLVLKKFIIQLTKKSGHVNKSIK